jgi:diguanylate cyclase (GGDEF)-like protein
MTELQDSSATPADSLVGTLVDGKYRIERVIGSGGMATVYAATRIQIGDMAAIKVLTPESTAVPLAVARFQREVRAAARIKHPNVISVYDFGTLPDGRAYMVMEYVTGESLREELKRTGPLPFERAVQLMTAVCAAIHTAHGEGIIHRDLKPENIMLARMRDGSETVKVVDFGVAELHESATATALTKLTEYGLMVGTPHYMSPEQCRSEPLDKRSDIYSLGIILYEMLTGTVPFNARTVSAVIIQQATEPPRRPRDLNPEIGWALEHVVLRALEKDPARRPQNANELAHDLGLALTNLRMPPPTGEFPAPSIRDVPLTPIPRTESFGGDSLTGSGTRGGTRRGSRGIPTPGSTHDSGSSRRSNPRRTGGLHFDSLTGVHNFSFLKQRIDEMFTASRSGSVLMLGVDGMKDLNGRLGYLAGDSLLRELAHWLREHVGEQGVVSRTVSDQFAVLMVDTPASDAMVFGDALLKSLSENRFLAGEVAGGLSVGLTIGVVSVPDDASSSPELIEVAGHALRNAKQESPGGIRRLGEISGEFRLHPNYNAFVGRKRELARLSEAFDQAISSRSKPVLVTGATGVGKTRLGQEFRRLLAGKDITFLTVHFYESGQGTPYKAFYDSLKPSVQAILEAEDAETANRVFGPLVDRLSTEFGGDDGFLFFCEAVQSENQHEKFLNFEYLASIYGALASQRIVILFIDDAHFADELSLELLAYLARFSANQRLLLYLAARTEAIPDVHPLRNWMRVVNQSVGFESLNLEPLSVDDTHDLVRAIFPRVRVASSTIGQLYGETKGNPYFLVEILRFLVQKNHIVRAGDGWEFPPIGDITLPQSVVDVVEASFGRLSPSTLEIFSQAAVIGDEFSFDMLQAVTERTERDLLNAIEEGLAQGLVTEITDREEDTYRFRHGTVQKVLYSRLNRRRRRSLHNLVGQSLEKHFTASGQTGRVLGKLAFHFHQAGEHQQTLRYGTAAGNQAWRTWSIDEALKYYGWAEEAEGRLNVLVDIIFDENHASFANISNEQLKLLVDLNLNFGQLLVSTGSLFEAEKKLQLAQTLSRPLNDEQIRGKTLSALGELCEARSEYSSALLYCRQALEVLRRTGDKRAEARVMCLIGTVYDRLGQLSRAVESLEKGLHLAQTVKDRAVEAMALRELGYVNLKQGQFSRGVTLVDQSIQISRRLNHLLGLSISSSVIGYAFRLQGNYEAALQQFQESLRISADLNRPRSEAIELANLSECYREMGDFSSALECGQRALEIARGIGSRQLEGSTLMAVGRAYAARGEFSPAGECFTAALKLLSGISDRLAECEALLDSASLQLDQKHPGEALEFVQQAMSLTDETALVWRWRLLYTLGRCFQESGQTDAARESFRQAFAITQNLLSNLSRDVTPDQFNRSIQPLLEVTQDFKLDEDRGNSFAIEI